MFNTHDWKEMFYHPTQHALLNSKARLKIVVAGRGSGKSEIAKRYVTMQLFKQKPWPDPKYFYFLPTTDQGRRVAWEHFKRLIPEEFIASKGSHKQINENRMVLKTIFGSQLHILSGEKPERAEGVQWDGGVIDEMSDQKPTIYDLNLGPALTHRDPWVWIIGVPKRRGIGAKKFHEMFLRGQTGNDPDMESFHWLSKDILSEKELASRKARMSPQDYREQYEASWEIATGLAFPDFSNENITDKAIYHPSLPIIVGSDFNVDPMCWCLAHFVDIPNSDLSILLIFDEIYLRGTNTRKTLDHLWERYSSHKAGWIFIGDASSRARKTSADSTDYLQIANDKRFSPREMLYPSSNPKVSWRIDTANAAILNANNQRRIFVNPSCEHVIKDFQYRYYKEGTSELADVSIDEAGHSLGHMSDAATYIIFQLMPMANPEEEIGKFFIRSS